MGTYSRARKHIDMKRVKEMREENIKREKIAEILRQQEEIRAELAEIEAEESKHVDWRQELEEGMTTAGMGMINYPPEGDVNLGAAMSDISLSGDGGLSGFNSITRSSTSSYKQFDTMVVSITTSSSDWVISPGGSIQTLASGGSGSHTIVISKSYSSLYFSAKDDGSFSASVQYQRRAPVSVVVSLDDPEANAFLRDGQLDNLSPGEKKKKLEEQLRLSKEYLDKMFGEGMPKGATQIADYEPQQSFMDIQVGGERITKQNGRTITDTTRGIEDGKMDGEPLNTPQPTPTKSAVPKLYQNRSAAWMGGSIQSAATTIKNGEGFLKDQFRGTDVSVSKLMSLGKQLARLNKTIGSGRGSVEQLQRLIDLRNNTQERIKAEIDGGKPDLTPITQVPSSSDNQAELEKNIEASLKQLEIDNKQLKGDALKRNLGLAVDLGLDILTVVTLLTPIPGDEVAALSAQAAKAGVKTGAKNVSQKAVQTSLKKNAYNNIADDVANDAARVTADLLMNKSRYGDDAFKYVNKLQNAASSGNTSAVQKIVKQIERLDPLRGFNKPSVPKPSPSPRTNPGGAYPRNSPMRPVNTPQGTLGNSYQPQGEVIKEKKSFKDITKKIPGYYDGKPSPLGFPIVEPPKMKNGMHPDLVDGKKTAKRFNRLDPISAKAMPKTGNPHIDKKVKAAAKKPK